MFDLESAHHEAAHVVVARHHGARVTEIRIDQPNRGVAGWCSIDPRAWFPPGQFSGRTVEYVSTFVAAELWLGRFERRQFPRAGGFGYDREAVTDALRASTPPDALELRMDLNRRSKELAMEVLEERQADVRAVADRLAKFGRFDVRTGWTRAEPPRRQVAPPMFRSAPPSTRKEVLRGELRHLVDSGGLSYGEAMDRWISAGYRSNGVRGVA